MVVFGMGLAALLASPPAAHAQPRFVVVAGTSHGGDQQLAPRANHTPSCATCFAAGGGVPMDRASDPRLATVGLGLVGNEGRIRGGGELFTILGFGDAGTSGYSGVVTTVGVDSGRLFATGGLGLGSYWGGQHDSFTSALAGNARAELGLRVHDAWMILGRGDLLVNSTSVSPVVTLGLEWVPPLL